MITKTLTLINGATSTVAMPISAITFQVGTKFAVVSGTTFPINVPIGGQSFIQIEFDNLINTGDFAETATIVVDGFVNLTVNLTATDEAVTIVLTVPDAITTLTGTNGDAQTVLTWTNPSDGGSVITGFNIRQDGTIVGNLVASSPQTILGLTNGTSYNFDVRAVNSIGEALISNIATVIPQVPAGGNEYQFSFGNTDLTNITDTVNLFTININTPVIMADISNDSTAGVTILMDTGWTGNGISSNPASTGTVFFEDYLFEGYGYAPSAETRRITFNVPDDGSSYTVLLSGSRGGATQDRKTQVTLNGVTQIYQTSFVNGDGNSTEGATFTGVVADVNGNIVLDVAGNTGDFIYVNGGKLIKE